MPHMLSWLKNLSGPLLKHSAKQQDSAAVCAYVIPRDQHPITRKNISDNALKVMYRLNKSGFDAYLVGGSVRDLLLGKQPKDFDVTTDATPEQVKSLFGNARIIGKRFRIVHVRFGREIIEVTTYRGHHPEPDSEHQQTHNHQSSRNENGMLLRDNIYGTIEEDAKRRDFTVNAMYYTVADFSVHDYCHGLQDLRDRFIRIIGDPQRRYREDPVRMLRAVRFAAKLDFNLHRETAMPLVELGALLDSVPAARLFDEVLKLFTAGYSLSTYQLLREHQLFGHLFPESNQLCSEADADKLYTQAFINTDTRIKEGKTITPAFIYAALLWPVLCREMQVPQIKESATMSALHEAANTVIQQQNQRTSIPRRFQIPMREIWELQFRLPKRSARRAEKLFNHPRFRAAYDFLLLREQAGEIPPGLGQWWQEYQDHNVEQRESQLRALHQRTRKDKHRRQRRPRNPTTP